MQNDDVFLNPFWKEGNYLEIGSRRYEGTWYFEIIGARMNFLPCA